ncbi:MAG: YggT family protein [Oscillochloridaceae bacterium umkhey_bin13]
MNRLRERVAPMTTELSQKFPNRVALLIAGLAGVIEALLVLRLVARLLAARPDNPAIMVLYGLTTPLVQLLQALDYDQPPFGAALEFSTLVIAVIVPLLAYLTWRWLDRRNPEP